MTNNTKANETVILEEKIEVEDGYGDYMRLEDSNNGENGVIPEVETPNRRIGRSRWFWAKWIALCVSFGVLIVVTVKWAGPFFMRVEVIPFINWEMETFSTPALAAIVVATVALLPALFLPTTPSMWVAGMTFGYVNGFLLIIAGVAAGVSIPYFVGSLFNNRIQRWLDKHPKQASIVRLAGDGNWFHQFKAVTLIRLSPFPYVLFNYVAVATDVKYCPYLLGSLLGMVPEIFLAIYSGILIQTMADATRGHKSISTLQKAFDITGFCASVTATIVIGIYANKKIKKLHDKEEPQLG
ncbi:uncharacterized protein LOC132299091 [Cornus florida]|uniref:uncharacterized protein LOC132299091 n=1 Tax=Cornus florida TaxID=4283 RepID=UPI002896EEF1|nr:uncharacterized protein LOC132299091 [Cornus florida]